ncbi:MAG: metallophosphoesterase [Maribacter sp.]
MNYLKYFWYLILFLALGLGLSCASKKTFTSEGLQIAVMADIHLQDVYGKLEDSHYKGIMNPENGNYALIRTMGSQLHSTRIFNENYFAFLAALDDVVKRKVKYVILPGDFSDDGQVLHIRGLKRILQQYSKSYGISFFLITGNHDVVKPFTQMDGKNDFLGEGGKSQPIMSHSEIYKSNPNLEHPVVLTSEIQNLGYQEITGLLGDFGFFPKKDHIYWETPFSNYNYDNYSFRKAKISASLEDRSYLIAGNDIPLPDISYLVEPVNGLWFLALDANTYLRRERPENDKGLTVDYTNTGTGHDNLLNYKSYLMDWVAKVVSEADKRGKTLIAFSHYPMVEFNNGASEHIDNLLVGSKMQLKRVPDEKVAQRFADAGLKVHFGGHMHLNDTGISTTEKGNTLVNIQAPSLAAYIPAYKLLTIEEENILDVKTLIVDSVPRFKEFFKLYEQEHEFLKSIGSKNIWNKDILSSKSYHEFTNWHLKELVRLRFLKAEWSSEFIDFILKISGEQLFVLSQWESTLSIDAMINTINDDSEKTSTQWKKANALAAKNGIQLAQFKEWSGFDLLCDLYRLRSADELAFKDIGADRLKQYGLIQNSFLSQKSIHIEDDFIKKNVLELMRIFEKFLNGAPSDHFQLNLNTGKLHSLKEQ